MENLDSFIKGMPKAELHVHVEGTLEPELKFELAGRNNLDLPYGSAEDMRTAYDFDDLPSFLKIYYEGMGILLVEPLNEFHIGGFPLGFWFAQQGSIYVFIGLVWLYARWHEKRPTM